MMRLGKYSMAALAATMLVVTPVAAQAAPAAKANTAVKRISADRNQENKLEGGSSIIIYALAAAAVIAGIIIIADDNKAKSP